MYIDLDAIIMNDEVKVEEFLEEKSPFSLLTASDINGLNSGIFIVRNDEIAIKLFEEVI